MRNSDILRELKTTSKIDKGYILPYEAAINELSVYVGKDVNPFNNMNILTTWFTSDINKNAFLRALLDMREILQWNTVTCLVKNGDESFKIVYSNDGSYSSASSKWNGEYKNDKAFKKELKNNDIIITCDSYFGHTTDLILECQMMFKKFIILGGRLLTVRRDIYQMFENHTMWYGGTMRGNAVNFCVSDDYDFGNYKIDDYGHKYMSVSSDRFYTNIPYDYRHRGYMELTKKFNMNDYKSEKNYSVIGIDKCEEIPYDFNYPIAVTTNVLNHMDCDGLMRFTYTDKNKIQHLISYVLEGSNQTVSMNAKTFSDHQFAKVVIAKVDDVELKKVG